MGYGWGFGQCAPKCTHRRLTDAPEIEWSAGVANCASVTVLDSCIDASGNTFIVGRWQDKTNFGFAQQIDPADGSAIWTKHYRGTIHCCTTDGTSLWIGGESLANSIGLPTENLFKLDPDDGETVWSVTSWHAVIYDCIHDGAGKVYVCGTVNPYQSGEFNWSDPGGDYGNYLAACGYASLYDASGTREDSFGGSGADGLGHWDALTQDQALSMGLSGPGANIVPFIPSQGVAAYSIDRDSEGNLFVGSDVWISGCSSVGTCGNVGSVAKFNAAHELQWLFGNRICGAVRYYDGDLYCGFNKTIVSVSESNKKDFEPFAQLQRWTTDEVTRVWGRTLQVDKPFVEGENIRPVGVTDIEVSTTGVYATHQWWLSKLDHSGGYEWSTRHAKADVGAEERGTTYYTVELDPSETETETLYVGGRGAKCGVDDQDDSTTPASGDCEPTWVCTQKPNTRGPHGGIYSWICEGKQIPCSVDDTFYGSGCFSEVEPVPHTWRWQGGCHNGQDGIFGWTDFESCMGFSPDGRWVTEFDIPCGEGTLSVIMTARQVSGTSCSGWEVLYNVSGVEGCSNSGAATVGSCPCDSDGWVFEQMPFSWSATFITEDCACCDEGGGGNVPPGVEVACCEGVTLPTTLTAEFTNCFTATVSLVYNSGTAQWEGLYSCSGVDLEVTLRCVTGTWILNVNFLSGTGGANCESGDVFTFTPMCDPLILEFAPVPVTDCPCCPGGGFLIATVTE